MSEYRIISGELRHHGIKGQKWGVRRFQNKDGSYTPAGKKRRDKTDGSTTWDKENQLYAKYRAEKKAAGSRKEKKEAKKRYKSGVEDLYDKNYKLKGNDLRGIVGTVNYETDRRKFGSRGVARINDRMNAGESYNKAYAKEYARYRAKGLAFTAAMSMAPIAFNAALVASGKDSVARMFYDNAVLDVNGKVITYFN